MANSAQARKRARQAVKRRAHNVAQRSEYRTAIKKVRKAIQAGDKAQAKTALDECASTVDRIADKDILHKNTAARYKSRLAQAIKAMG
ncbi:MAG TPA: 30S ribosomal protein S20 [Pelomicrobium sp.]|nr:30S ribosomal protein S20 [Pelomicrobium sp.]